MKGLAGEDEIVRTSVSSVDDEGAFEASSALEVHRAIYQATDARAVVHAHPSKTVSLSFFHEALVPIDENGLLYLRPKVSVVAPPSLFGWNLAAEELAGCLKSENVVVQKWHGTFAKGRDLAEAFHRTRAVEFMSAHLIRIQELRQYYGEPTPLPARMAEVIGGLPGRGLRKLRVALPCRFKNRSARSKEATRIRHRQLLEFLVRNALGTKQGEKLLAADMNSPTHPIGGGGFDDTDPWTAKATA